MKKILILYFLVSFLSSRSQMCYNVSSIAYNPDPFTTGTNLGLFIDDVFSSKVTLPFQFCFDGTMYSKVIISTNGYLSFNLAMNGGYSDWQINVPVPTNNPSTITNAILGPWQDLDVSVSGNIYYNTYGTTPNRRFVVSFSNVAMFQCNAKKYTGQITLYETSYDIDIIINLKQTCPLSNAWNNEWAVEGVNNAAGTIAFTSAGRNATVWGAPTGSTVANEAYRISNCNACTVLPIELLKFEGTPGENYNLLKWTTASEVNNDYFIIEKSNDAAHFTEVGRVKGSGNSNKNINYSLKDFNQVSGINYYQLHSVDYDKNSHFSNVIAVENNLVEKKPVKITNIIGQDVNENYEGIKIIYFSDGTVIKQL